MSTLKDSELIFYVNPMRH